MVRGLGRSGEGWNFKNHRELSFQSLDHRPKRRLDREMKVERLYEQARKELADSPKEELLRKSISEADGDEEKGKALYIETRVKELEEEEDLEDRLVHSTSCVLEETIKSLWPNYDKEVEEMLEEEEEERLRRKRLEE